MKVNVHGYPIGDKELKEVVDRAVDKYGDALLEVDITVEEEELAIQYKLRNEPFERIRRITGYLVGTLDKWNDAKRAEEHERVKHE